MTPKEKAQELIEKYTCYRLVRNFDLNTESEKDFKTMRKWALIAVDEIIKSFPTKPNMDFRHDSWEDMIDDSVSYWQEVKQEIEKL